VHREVTRRSVLAGAAAASAQLLFSRTLIWPASAQELASTPGLLNVRLTAMNPFTLRIGIAPVTAEPLQEELGVVATEWPAPLERHAGAREIRWEKYTVRIGENPFTVAVLENGKLRQEIRFDTDSTDIHFNLDGPIFGLGEGAHVFDRRGTSERLINGQSTPDLRTFGARVEIPWLFSPTGWGIFIGQPQGNFEFTRTEGVFHGVEATSTRNVFLMLGDSPAGVLHQYAHLTGMPHMPPRWTLGYLQSHRTLASKEEVLDVPRTFREKKLPCDGLIYLGTGFCPSGWNTGHGSFTFNDKVFPDPQAIFKQMHEEHFNIILHVVPPGDFHGRITDTGAAAEVPSDAAPYWAKHAALPDVDGWWPDEGDQLSVYSRFDRNRMYFEGSRHAHPDRRPFALHRNGYAGLQRFGWLWSGDTFSTWATLRAQIMVGINTGLSGIPYWGTDIGGFVPTSELTPELYLRWFQWSAFCPLFRGHGRAWKLRLPWGWNTGDAGPKEMTGDWVRAWPPEADLHRADVEPICRKYLNLRYQLLPYNYYSLVRTHETGVPLMRALCLDWPDDAKAVLIDDEYLWGESFLVAPVHEKGARAREVYLPAGDWWDFWSGARAAGNRSLTREVDLETMPLYVKAGAIVPMGPVRQHTGEAVGDPVTLRVYPGADGRFAWYDDDGSSYRHETGDFMRVECAWNDKSRTLTLNPDGAGKMPVPAAVRVELAGEAISKLVSLGQSVTTVKL